jgi:hypothetical protein
MDWEVEFSDEFAAWWDGLSEDEQDSVAHGVELLQEFGPTLKRPYADTLSGSSHANMRELRCQHDGRPYRVLYAFDPRRMAFLCIGGEKTGNPRWYDENLPKADAIFSDHLETLKREVKQ